MKILSATAGTQWTTEDVGAFVGLLVLFLLPLFGTIVMKLLRRAKLKKICDEISHMPEFHLTREVAEFLGKEFRFTKKLPGKLWSLIAGSTLAKRAVYDPNIGVRWSRELYLIEAKAFVEGYEPLRKLLGYLVAREPQPAIRTLQEIFSANLGALPLGTNLGVDVDSYQESLLLKLREYTDRIIKMCIPFNQEGQQKTDGQTKEENYRSLLPPG